MYLMIRQEQENDYPLVFDLIARAFESKEMSDHQEHLLVDRLRNSEAFIPELSVVAEIGNKIVGHILLTKIKIQNDSTEFESLALAPVSVLPEFQGKGIGGKLIIEAHSIARESGYKSIMLLGHVAYYPRFGYRPAAQFGIKFPFDAPGENCMAIELVPGALENVTGEVIYPREFFM